ncbi:MAG: EAL domain-containing protein [Proteobacteria bacterium]|nr:EAL domain-containing protein [Pseudomonadota bacterium]
MRINPVVALISSAVFIVGAVAVFALFGMVTEDVAFFILKGDVSTLADMAGKFLDAGAAQTFISATEFHLAVAGAMTALWIVPALGLVLAGLLCLCLYKAITLAAVREEARMVAEKLAEMENTAAATDQARKAAEVQARQMHERITDCFALLDRKMTVLHLNPQARNYLLGLDKDRNEERIGLGQHVDMYLSNLSKTNFGAIFDKVVTAGKPTEMELNLPDVRRWYKIQLYPANDGVYMYFNDITADKVPHLRIQRTASLIRQVVDQEPRALAVVDQDWRYLMLNRNWRRQFAMEPAQSIGRSHLQLLPTTLTHPKEIALQLMHGEAVLLDEAPVKIGDRNEWISWELRPWWDDNNAIGGYLLYATFTTDVRDKAEQTERQRAQEKRLAYQDILTGLPNRQAFYEKLNEALGQAYQGLNKVALMFLDLDGFKAVNDNLGHDAGDMLLKQVSQRLGKCVRGSDVVARLGGDEFTVILTNVRSEEDVAAVATKIIDAVAPEYQLGGQVGKVTTSLGIAMYPDHATTSVDMIKFADNAMFNAKESGKNQYKFHQSGVEGEIAGDVNQAVRDALAGKQFDLVFQPQVNLVDNKVVGMEALLRWRHPEHGNLEPGKFLGKISDKQVAMSLTEWVLREAAKQALEWRRSKGGDVAVAVNIFAQQMGDPELPKVVDRVMGESGLPAGTLGLEFSEEVIADKRRNVGGNLEALKATGARLIIDDFGTGLSSFMRLKEFPLDAIKIHHKFVRNLADSEQDRAIAKSIIDLGKNLGLGVMAEGVESAAQADFLRKSGCEQVQGFMFGRPVRPGKMSDFMPERKAGEGQKKP